MAVSLAHGAHLAEQELRQRRRTASSRARTFVAKNNPDRDTQRALADQEFINKYRRRGSVAGFAVGGVVGRGTAAAVMDTAQYATGKPYMAGRYLIPAQVVGGTVGATAGVKVGDRLGAAYGRYKLNKIKRRMRRDFYRDNVTRASLPVPIMAESMSLAQRARAILNHEKVKEKGPYYVTRFGVQTAARNTGGAIGAVAGTAFAGGLGFGTMAGLVSGSTAGHVIAGKAYTPKVHAYMVKDWQHTKKNYLRRRKALRGFRNRHRLMRAGLYEASTMSTTVQQKKKKSVKYNPRVTTATSVPQAETPPMTVLSKSQRFTPHGTRPTSRQAGEDSKYKKRLSGARNIAGRTGINDSVLEGKIADYFKRKGKEKLERATKGPPGVGLVRDIAFVAGAGFADERTTARREIKKLLKKKVRRRAKSVAKTMRPVTKPVAQGSVAVARGTKKVMLTDVKDIARGTKKVMLTPIRFPRFRKKKLKESAAAMEALRTGRRALKRFKEKTQRKFDEVVPSPKKKKLTRLEKLPKPTRRYNRMEKKLGSSIESSGRYANLPQKEKDRIKYGVMRKQGWKPKRERKYQVQVGG